MIKIDIKKSGKREFIGEQAFYFNILTLGSKGSDIPLSDLKENIFVLAILDGKLEASIAKGVDFFLLNGKRSLKSKTLRPGDKIEFLDCQFEVINFHQTIKPEVSSLAQKLERIKENDPEGYQVIQKIKELHS